MTKEDEPLEVRQQLGQCSEEAVQEIRWGIEAAAGTVVAFTFEA